MKCGRKVPAHPVSPTPFSEALKSWWYAMQPEERGEQGQNRLASPIPLTSWTSLAKSGRNGFFLIVMSLFWWRCALDNISGDALTSACKDWENLVGDVAWALHEIVACNKGDGSPSESPSSRSQQSQGSAAVSNEEPSASGPRRGRSTAQKHPLDSDNGKSKQRKRRRC